MKTINEFLKEWGMFIIIPMVLIMFFRTCNTSNDVEKNHISSVKRDSAIVANITIVKHNLLTDTIVLEAFSREMWTFLELEELADKNNISIMELKHNRKDK